MTPDQYKILIPSEYEGLWEGIKKDSMRIVVDCLMFTGMRYEELSDLSHTLTWFDAKNRAISLPASMTKTGKTRTVHLTPAFTKRLSMYLNEYKVLNVPDRRSMNFNLRRWGMDGSVKIFRKSWESWLLAAGYPSMAVALSQGHTELISYGHYANLDPRLKSEMNKVRELTAGWGT
jgi:integrase